MWASYKLLSKYCSKDYKKKSYNKWSKKLSKISCPKNIHKIHPPVVFWNMDFDERILTNSVFCLFRTWILQTIQVVKIKFGVHWNSFLKIHLKKNQVQINKGYIWQHSLCDNSPKMWYPHFGAGPLTFVCGFLLTIFWPNSEIDIETWNKCWLQINVHFWGLRINIWGEKFDL